MPGSLPYDASPLVDEPDQRHWARALRPGELTPQWRVIVAFTWSLVFVAFIAVATVSRQLGLSTWWQGPLGNPRTFVVQTIPFLPSAAVIIAVLNRSRITSWIGLAGAAWIAVVAWFDLSDIARLAAVEFAIAAAAAVVSLASLTGRVPRPPHSQAETPRTMRADSA